MKAHFIRADDERKIFQGDLLATLYNTSANRDFKQSPAQRTDFYLTSTDTPKKRRWKPSKKDKGAIEFSKKVSDALDRRFNQP